MCQLSTQTPPTDHHGPITSTNTYSGGGAHVMSVLIFRLFFLSVRILLAAGTVSPSNPICQFIPGSGPFPRKQLIHGSVHLRTQIGIRLFRFIVSENGRGKEIEPENLN